MALDEKEKQEWADQLKALKTELTSLIAEAKAAGEAHSPSISALKERLEKVTKQLETAEAQLAEAKAEKEAAAKAAKDKADKEAKDREEAEAKEREEADKAGLSLAAYRKRKKEEEEGHQDQRTTQRKRPAAGKWV